MNNKLYTKLPQALTAAAAIAVSWLGQPVAAQTPVTQGCGTEIQHVAVNNPGFYERLAAFQSDFQQWLQTADLSQFETSESGSRIIPVVVHVLHEGGTENISKAQIESQIDALNEDFQKLNPGLSGLSGFPVFDTLVANCDLEFRLATKDPQGNCTDGIVRIFTPKTNEAKDWSKFKSTSYWDRSKYYNLWVVKSIYNDSQWGSILGYAQFPYAFGNVFPLTSTDGVAVISTSFGRIGTANGGTGATTSHETGHWLGLRHIWGDDSCASDGVDDTPIHGGPNFSGVGCFPLPKPALCYSPVGLQGQDSIDAVFNRDQRGEMWMNFMDYTDDNCLWMFTKGQLAVMNFVFQQYSFRGNLITAENNVNTGTDDASFNTPCAPAPIANFWAHNPSTDLLFSMNLRCAGQDVQFTDGTYNGTPTSRNWTFEGGTPNTSTATNPTVVYNTPGVYDVSLTSANSQGTSTKDWNDYIHVLPATADDNNIIYYDDFEYSTSLYEQGKWILVNEGNTTNRWEQYVGAGYLSSKSMVMKNMDNIKFETDALISPSYNLQSFPNDKLYFRYAYATRTNNPNLASYVGYPQEDMLEVYTSTNCGESWTKRNIKIDGSTSGNITGNRLITAGLYPNGFVPSEPSHWKLAEVDLSAVASNDNVRIMFRWTAGGAYGNDFYLDVVNISNSQAIGVEEQQLGQTGFEVYPNPISSTSQVYFNLIEKSDVTIDVIDLTGRQIRQLYSGQLSAGEQYYQVNHADFGATGVYMVRLNINGVTSIKKVVVN